jgi:mRNA-degrading endonuclease RelE of RelBE toxin-antitoxin system
MVKMSQTFEITYDPEVKTHLRFIEVKYHTLIRKAIEEQLAFEPHVETRNRKPLLPTAELDADWELRCGPDNRFRVFYFADLEGRTVHVLAIGVKKGNRLAIAGEEIRL